MTGLLNSLDFDTEAYSFLEIYPDVPVSPYFGIIIGKPRK